MAQYPNRLAIVASIDPDHASGLLSPEVMRNAVELAGNPDYFRDTMLGDANATTDPDYPPIAAEYLVGTLLADRLVYINIILSTTLFGTPTSTQIAHNETRLHTDLYKKAARGIISEEKSMKLLESAINTNAIDCSTPRVLAGVERRAQYSEDYANGPQHNVLLIPRFLDTAIQQSDLRALAKNNTILSEADLAQRTVLHRLSAERVAFSALFNMHMRRIRHYAQTN